MDDDLTDADGNRSWRAYAPWVVALAFTLSGAVHLLRPSTFTGIVPKFLPAKQSLVYVSGAAELACAAGLWRSDRWAAYAGAGLLIVVWPANLQMAITAQQGHDVGRQVATWVRLPLQLPLIWCALQSGRTRRRPPDRERAAWTSPSSS